MRCTAPPPAGRIARRSARRAKPTTGRSATRTPSSRVIDLSARAVEARAALAQAGSGPGADRRPPRRRRDGARARPRRRTARRADALSRRRGRGHRGRPRRPAPPKRRWPPRARTLVRAEGVRAAGRPRLGHGRRTHPGAAGRQPGAARPARRPEPGDRGKSPPPAGTLAASEREDMGPVNLRAEVEAEEVEKQIATIGHRARGADHRDRQAARLDRPSEPRGPRTAERGVPAGRPAFPGAVHPHVRRRPGASGAGRLGRSAGGGAGNLRPAAGQETGDAVACCRAASRR